MTYLSNRTRGQWRAHGRYLARESATESKTAPAGFDRERDGIDIAGKLETWQSAGDQRLWEVIVSPEFGDRIDLQRLVRDLVGRIQTDLGTDLEWRLSMVEYHFSYIEVRTELAFRSIGLKHVDENTY